jgi:hypothetical protein
MAFIPTSMISFFEHCRRDGPGPQAVPVTVATRAGYRNPFGMSGINVTTPTGRKALNLRKNRIDCDFSEPAFESKKSVSTPWKMP